MPVLACKVVKVPAKGVEAPIMILFNWLPPPATVPVRVVAPNLVTVKVSVRKVKSLSSERIPAVPAKVTLPAVNPESVRLAKVGEEVVKTF